ncbi:DNA-binding transcriptional regulator, ArsR family [Butyrivibrio sp. ob235]|uniref:ArsR/SmtB family transcription factor n=1 Tax=Butyrivibrio sp. ob235 TaxID=1761780 RepID=UPI0008B000B8|nr:ArsR family transcriptional regulator [Butyrivibrio sp. ob235]SEM61131.1 DNA-binding transcriptional regulator, ArsR family [Butyrivibrio sp. ob235]
MNHFHLEVQYVHESITLLNMIAQPAGFETEYMNRLAARYGITPDEEAKRYVELLQEIEDAARAEFSKDSEDIRFFCGMPKLSESIISFANVLMLVGKSVWRESSVSKYYDELKDLSEAEYNRNFYDEVKAFGSRTVDEEAEDEISALEIFDLIQQMDFSDAEKLHLQKLYIHHKEYCEKFASLMERSAKVIKKFEKKLIAKGKRVAEHFESLLNGTSMAAYIMNEFYGDHETGNNFEECDIYITYIKGVSMGLSFKMAPKAIVNIGAIFDPSIRIEDVLKNQATLDEDKVLLMLKLLADKSKFEILSATVDKPAYGAQLASMLGLTTATISHHTSALLDQNLLTLDKVDTKIYYRANPDMIRTLINFVKKELLHE